MKKTALDFLGGLFVVLGFIALLFLALKAGNMSSLSFQATYPVKLKFDNIGGLKPRAPVKSAGVTVGRVASIGFDTNTYQALVTINLDQQDPAVDLDIATKLTDLPVGDIVALNNSFGFGGANVAVAFGSI